MTLKEARRLYQEKLRKLKKEKGIKQNKYNAEIIQDGLGKHSGSQLELSVLALYRLMANRGEISELKHQQTFEIVAGIKWRLDFSFMRDGHLWVGEAKGYPTNEYLLKLKLWREFGKHPLEIWKGDARRPFIDEIIFPKGFTK